MFPFGVYRGEKGPLREKSQASGNSKERKRGEKVSEAKEKRLSNVMTREGGVGFHNISSTRVQTERTRAVVPAPVFSAALLPALLLYY